MKYCAICSAELAESEIKTDLPETKGDAQEPAPEQTPAPALLFIGKYGRKHEICPACEEKMDELLTSESPAGRKDALDYLYTRLFDPEFGKTSGEVIEYFRTLLSDEEALAEASRNLAESADADAAADTDTDADTESDTEAVEAPAEEESFLSKEPKKTSLGVKLVFLFLFLLVGGGTLAYGIIRSSVFTIVIGSIIILLGIGSVFAKD